MTDSPISRYQERSENGDSIRKKALWLSLLQAVAAIFFILLSARYVTVLVLSLKEEPVFSAPKTIYLPQRELEHQMAVSEFQNAAATPATIPALSTESLLANAPSLPAIPDVEFTPVENEAMVSDSNALFGQSGLMGALRALSSQTSSVSFLGITEEAARFVIVVDVSRSVVDAVKAANFKFDVIREEAERIIKELNANTQFGFILHARGYISIQNNLILATVNNKELAIDWLRTNFNDTGNSPNNSQYGDGDTNGLIPILGAAFKMQPDVIFLVSNGGYFTNNNKDNSARDLTNNFGRPVEIGETLRYIRECQKNQQSDVRIHAIHFEDPRAYLENRDSRIGSDMRRIATANRGKYRKIN